MTTRRFCDVCGEEIIMPEATTVPGPVLSGRATFDGGDEWGTDRVYDLCRRHAKMIRDWIQRMQGGENA